MARLVTLGLVSFGAVAVAMTTSMISQAAPEQIAPQIKVPPKVLNQPIIPNVPQLQVENWGFESGLTGWEKVGTAFDNQPTYGDNVAAKRVVGSSPQFAMPLGGDYWSDVAFPIGHKGNRWIGTFERHPENRNFGQTQGDGPIGNLTSKSFVTDKPVISFLIGGGQDPGRLAVALYERESTDNGGVTACAPYTAPRLMLDPKTPIAPQLKGKPPVFAPPGGPQPAAPPVTTAPPVTAAPPAASPIAQQIQCNDGVYKLVSGTVRTGLNSELMRRDWWNATAQRNKPLRIRIVDGSPDAWGHINVDDFRFEAMDPTRIPSPVGGASRMAISYTFRPAQGGQPAATGFIDWDAPIWGMADLHTHPMSYLGFGKKLMFGRPDGDMAKELADCNDAHGGWGLDNGGGNYLRATIVNLVDKSYILKGGDTHPDHPHRGGAPDFKNWPSFSSATHQQMRWEWIKRAQQGGLRVLVALAVNNQLLADGIDGVGAYTAATGDKASGDEQIRAMKDFVAWIKRQPGGDFLDIVTDPAQMRDTIRKGKLAVILGVELDNIGDFNRLNVAKSEAAVTAEVRRLHGLGVRYAFPVHVTDNAFGGAAVYDDLFNLANRYAATQPLPPEVGAWAPGTAFKIEHAPDTGITFQLKPLLEGVPFSVAFQLRALLAGFEHLPTPFPNPCFPCPTELISLAEQSARCEAFKSSTGLRLNTIDPQVCGVPALEFRQMFQQKQYDLMTRYFLTPDPVTDTYARVAVGHRNQKGLTPLGKVAIKEMMRLGMLIDIDHMSEHSVDGTMDLALGVPNGGYPLISGHTGFRPMLSHEVNENQRSDAQLATLQKLGGMMGIGWGYDKDETGLKTRAFADVIRTRGGQGFTSSTVNYASELCAGTTRTFAQNYLYGIEKIGAVAFGSDVDGMIAQPGPRFGGNATAKGNRCNPQADATRVNYLGGREWSRRAKLVPSTALAKTWDYNIDGMAHYGLMPDFMQDLSQVGVNPQDMSPIFRSADALASSWTKAVIAAPTVR